MPIGTSEYKTRCCCPRSTVGERASSFPRKYTMSECVSDVINYEPSVAGIELTKPGDAAFDRGSCGATDQRHVVNLSAVYQVPGTSDGVARRADARLAGVGHRGRAQRHALRRHDGRGQRTERPGRTSGRTRSSDDVYREGGIALAEPGGLPGAGARHLRESREQQPRGTRPLQRRHGTHALVPLRRRASDPVPRPRCSTCSTACT